MGRMGRNRVYIATSQDGYIADADGKVYLLDTFLMPENYDMRFSEFMGRVDAILMEDKDFETGPGSESNGPMSNRSSCGEAHSRKYLKTSRGKRPW